MRRDDEMAINLSFPNSTLSLARGPVIENHNPRCGKSRHDLYRIRLNNDLHLLCIAHRHPPFLATVPCLRGLMHSHYLHNTRRTIC